MSKEICICLHGHFYQPPRENPWIEEVEQQDSASPFHDWNERIHYECYHPNSRARALDVKGKIVEIVNNFERISFNFGPTLLSWIEAKHPNTYRSILEADKASMATHRGHGNAIAQVYNHMILPLANLRDKQTQVRWGIADFKYRFGRMPESIWLAETACNEETLEVLIAEGIRYIILSPYQARSIRPVSGGNWQDVLDGHIDPKEPYRCFLKNNPALFIDIFFYDGPISKSIGFDNLLFDAKFFMKRLESAIVDREKTQIIHVATDGETYGHHKAYGDRVLAYLTYVEISRLGYRLVNYGEYLDEHLPTKEVKLIEGENGEGTSWSCAHGVARWKDHCGCRGDGPTNWTQHWRKPLRWALDWLRDELAIVYEKEGAKYFKDVWGTRDEYIQVVLNRTPETVWKFFEKYANRELTKQEVTICLKLLEMQRHLMLMYTSCGWFFTELSGIETVQILQYAARAAGLAQEINGIDYEKDLLERLALAKSNLEQIKDGRGVWEKYVRPSITTLKHIVSYYAIGSIFDNFYETDSQKELLKIFNYDLHIIHQRKEFFGTITMNFGRVKIVSRITLEEQEMIFVVIQIGFYDFRCSVQPFVNEASFDKMEKELFEALYQLPILELSKKIDSFFGEDYFALKDLRLGDRVKIINTLTKETIAKVSNFYENIYEENRRMNEIYRSINVPIPIEFRYAAEHTLGKRAIEEVREWGEKGFLPKKTISIYRILDSAKSLDVRINKEPISQYLSDALSAGVRKFINEPDAEELQKLLSITRFAKRSEIFLDKRHAQDDFFTLFKLWRAEPEKIPTLIKNDESSLNELLSDLDLNTDRLKNILNA